MTECKKPRFPAGFRFIRVYREGLIIPSARMRDMVSASSNRSPRGEIDDIENQRRMNRYGRMQASWRLPRAITNATNKLAVRAGVLKRKPAAVTRYRVALTD